MLKQFFTIGAALGLLAFNTSVSAETLSLTAAPDKTYKHTENSPCIISGQSCNKQPDGFDFTKYANGGVTTVTESSPTYTVGWLLNMFASGFSVGIDINEAKGKGAQTLDFFYMLVNGTIVDRYDGSKENVPTTANGEGFADYLLTGFTDLNGYASDATVQFKLKLSGMNDGPESFFLVANPAVSAVPLPASALFMMTGLGGMALRRRRQSVQ